MFQFTSELLQQHYAHHVGRPFFPDLCAFMKSAPVIVLLLGGENAISVVRRLVGPTDSRKAPKGTIRGDYGQDSTVNMVHASDSPEAVAAEIKRFFEKEEVPCPQREC